jgi:hypothetical protein
MFDLSIDMSHKQTTIWSSAPAVVQQGLFGAIMVNQTRQSAAHFGAAMNELGLSHISWPGGTIAEAGYFYPGTPDPRPVPGSGPPPAGAVRAYDMTYPDLFHPELLASGGRFGLSGMLDYAKANGNTLAIVLPSQHFEAGDLANPDQLGQLHAQFRALLMRLYSPEGDLFGRAPAGLILELGNENYSHVDQHYGPAAVVMADVARELRAMFPEADFKIGLQGMQSHAENHTLVDAFENPVIASQALGRTVAPDLLGEIDLIRRHALNLGMIGVAGLEHDPELVTEGLSAIFEGIERAGRPATSVDLYLSAYSA